jgi:surface carbohydrate biosynthesis protein
VGKNIIKKVFIFLKIKKIWQKPKKKKIVIYDHLLSFYLEKYLIKKDYVIYHNRFEEDSEINIFIILECLINFDFKLKTYKHRFFKYVNPKIIITMYENNPAFFKLKKEFPNLITIAIQKSWKYDVEFDIIYHRHKNKNNNLGYECDYIFCYNKFIAEIFSQFIRTKKIFVIGSFLSNSQKRSYEKKDYVVYISQWRMYGKRDKFHKNLNIGDWQKNEKFFLIKLSAFLKKKSFNLKILGRTEINASTEKSFYDEIFGDRYEFICQYKKRNHYQILDSARLTVSLDSTLGYENLARGNKTIFFSIRNNSRLNFDIIRFCWPERKGEVGPNWTNSLSYNEFTRLFSITDVSVVKWKEIINKHFKDTIIYNRNNSKFQNILKNIN